MSLEAEWKRIAHAAAAGVASRVLLLVMIYKELT